jgi:hypothetical protein
MRTANDVFGWTKKQWVYDPRKLCDFAKVEIEKKIGAIEIAKVRFYTGIPTHERDKFGRNYWEGLTRQSSNRSQ